jgi:hypothetical protein
MVEDRLEWNREIVHNVESILMRLSDPCPEAVHSLEILVSERQVRAAYRLETITRPLCCSVRANRHVDLPTPS